MNSIDETMLMSLFSYTKEKILDTDLLELMRNKSIVWNIEDTYNYMEDSLEWILRKKIEETFEVSFDNRSHKL